MNRGGSVEGTNKGMYGTRRGERDDLLP